MTMFNPLPFERTSAATDLLLGLLSLGLLIAWQRIKSDDLHKKKYWSAMFAFLAGSSILGAAAHGFNLPEAINRLLWYPLYFCLAGVIAFFLIGSLHDWRGKDLSTKCIPGILVAAFIIYLLFAVPDIFLVFIIYESIGLLLSLAIYFHLLIRYKQSSSFLMILGILLTMAAAIFQALGPFQWSLIWQFDHNGLFHLIQLPGIIVIFLGLWGSFRYEQKSHSNP